MKKILIILMTLCLFGCIGTEKSNIKGNITITYPENGNNNISNNDLTVVWEIDTTENLEYKVSIISSDGTVIQKSTTQKSIKFTNLESGKEYTVEVAGYLNGDKYGSDSVEITTAFGEVSLLYPLSGTVVSNLPTFAWSSTTEIETDLIYDVYVGESIESLLKVAGNISTNSYTLSVKLKDESEYFWRVVEKNGDGVKLKESEIYSFTTEQLNSNSETIDIPKIVNPAIGDLNKGIESDLEWSYIGDYSKIIFKVYLGSDINNLNLQNSLVGKLNYNISGLSYGTKYYWKVVASDSLGNSSESAIAYFTTEDAQIVLSTPSITAPAIGEIGVATATKLSWSYSGEYAGLIFKVYYGTSSSNLTLLGNVIGELSYNVSGLNNNTKYFWKIVAMDNFDNSSESLVGNFTTVSAQTTLSTPEIVAPANGAVGVSATTSLTWSYSGDYSGIIFKVYYGTSSSNLTLLGSVTGKLSYNLIGLSGNTKYYWMITATNSLNSSSVSTLSNFTTASDPVILSTPTISSPMNGATSVAVSPSLTWGYSGSYSNLTFKVYLGTSSTVLNLAGTTIGSLNYNAKNLNNSTKYYWKVEVSDLSGNTAVSSIANFTTLSTATSKVAVISSACTGCRACLSACTNGALTISGRKAVVNVSLCNGCGSCVSKCGKRAITIK